MSGQPSPYDQRLSRYEILLFWDYFVCFWAFCRVKDTRLFLVINNTLTMSKKHIWRLSQFTQGQMLYLLGYNGNNMIGKKWLVQVTCFRFTEMLWILAEYKEWRPGSGGWNLTSYTLYGICASKVPFRFINKLKNKFEDNLLIFVFNTNNENVNLKFWQFLYISWRFSWKEWKGNTIKSL